MPRSFTF